MSTVPPVPPTDDDATVSRFPSTDPADQTVVAPPGPPPLATESAGPPDPMPGDSNAPALPADAGDPPGGNG